MAGFQRQAPTLLASAEIPAWGNTGHHPVLWPSQRRGPNEAEGGNQVPEVSRVGERYSLEGQSLS